MIKRLLYFMTRAVYRAMPSSLRAAILYQVKYFQNEQTFHENVSATGFHGKFSESIEMIPENEAELIPRLIPSFNAARRKQQSLSRPYLPGGDWGASLEVRWRRYYEAISRNDQSVLAQYLRNFFRNEGIDGFWGAEKVFENFCKSGKVRDRLMLEHFAVWKSSSAGTLLEELEAPKIGNPWGYLFEGRILYEPVFEYHFQAHYLKQLLSRLETPVILEIGGGFGGLAYHILKCIPNVKYIGLDLPENVLLQTYYLSCAFPNAKIFTYGDSFATLDKTLIQNHDIILLPNFVLPQVEPMVADVIINFRSLSEMSADTICEYFRQIDRIGPLFFSHENIFKPRPDGYFGIPSCDFPELKNFTLIAMSESRWPKYQQESIYYPCQENLYIYQNVFDRIKRELPTFYGMKT